MNLTADLLFRWWRRINAGANHWLAAYYRTCGRAGLTLQRAAPRAMELRAGEVRRLDRTVHVRRIEVERGVIWLTGSPADGDVLLHAGENYSPAGPWRFVVQALEPARIILRT
jgi:hypothetical protein